MGPSFPPPGAGRWWVVVDFSPGFEDGQIVSPKPSHTAHAWGTPSSRPAFLLLSGSEGDPGLRLSPISHPFTPPSPSLSKERLTRLDPAGSKFPARPRLQPAQRSP